MLLHEDIWMASSCLGSIYKPNLRRLSGRVGSKSSNKKSFEVWSFNLLDARCSCIVSFECTLMRFDCITINLSSTVMSQSRHTLDSRSDGMYKKTFELLSWKKFLAVQQVTGFCGIGRLFLSNYYIHTPHKLITYQFNVDWLVIKFLSLWLEKKLLTSLFVYLKLRHHTTSIVLAHIHTTANLQIYHKGRFVDFWSNAQDMCSEVFRLLEVSLQDSSTMTFFSEDFTMIYAHTCLHRLQVTLLTASSTSPWFLLANELVSSLDCLI